MKHKSNSAQSSLPAIRQPSVKQAIEAQVLFMSIGDGAISTDEFGKITRVNAAALEILGFKENDLLGQWFPKCIEAVTEEGKAINLIDRPITRAFLTGRSVNEKMYYRRKNGQIIPVSVTVSPILLRGRPTGALEVFRDISVEEAIDRMKSEFISLASHQLRTPLSAIKTYSHMLVEGYMGEINTTQKKSLRTIIAATNRMNELISTLLNITRMETGSIAITPKQLHLDKVAEEVLKELSLMANDKSITVTLKQAGKASTKITSDNLIIKEVLINLVSNAIKYTPEGGTVNVTVKPRTKDVIVIIEDNGWGIPLASQDQIFSKFFRAENIVKRETTGTGLGLYLVRGLLERLGGQIWFSSQEGEGTTFNVLLPRKPPVDRLPEENV